MSFSIPDFEVHASGFRPRCCTGHLSGEHADRLLRVTVVTGRRLRAGGWCVLTLGIFSACLHRATLAVTGSGDFLTTMSSFFDTTPEGNVCWN
jgi:hypothetical protein